VGAGVCDDVGGVGVGGTAPLHQSPPHPEHFDSDSPQYSVGGVQLVHDPQMSPLLGHQQQKPEPETGGAGVDIGVGGAGVGFGVGGAGVGDGVGAGVCDDVGGVGVGGTAPLHQSPPHPEHFDSDSPQYSVGGVQLVQDPQMSPLLGHQQQKPEPETGGAGVAIGVGGAGVGMGVDGEGGAGVGEGVVSRDCTATSAQFQNSSP